MAPSGMRYREVARKLAGAFLVLALIFGTGSRCPLRATGDDDARVAVTPRTASRPNTTPRAAIRVDTRLVLIPVTVTDPLGAPFAGLPKDTFRLFEDGVEQDVKYFTAEDAPVSLGVVFDASRSMTGKIEQSRAAIAKFFNTTVPGDEFFLVEFSDRPRMLCDFTTSTTEIEKTLEGIEPRNWTALLDAVYMAMHQMKRARNPRKALLILSDGGDNYSRYTESEMRAYVREADVCIYSIGLVGGGWIKHHVRLLRNLSEETGGRLWEIDNVNDLPEAAAKISSAIRHQYVLGYSPNNSQNNGLYRKVQVKLNSRPDLPRLRASWRTGYYAPADD